MLGTQHNTLTSYLGSISITVIFATSLAYGADDLRLGLIEDAAGLFNERGYLKANSFSVDGSEAINDFNGNLIYKQTLISQPGFEAGLDFELAICYNGSVAHESHNKCAFVSIPGQQTAPVNLPEWIVSVNNIAVQTFNFETEFLSFATQVLAGDTVSIEADVSALITGYHSCYTGSQTDYVDHYGTISILMGDGSVAKYVSLNDDPGNWGLVPGEYRSFSKEDRSRGWLTLDSENHQGEFTLFKEDGVRVVFEVYRPVWRTDVEAPPMDSWDSLTILLPIRFENHMGHSFEVNYDYSPDCSGCPSEKIWGRPVITKANYYIFDWAGGLFFPGTELDILWFDGRPLYNIQFLGASTTDTLNRGFVSSIQDTCGRLAEFDYTFYKRLAENVGDPLPYICENRQGLNAVAANNLMYTPRRLQQITYPGGGRVFFTYHDDPQTQWPGYPTASIDELSVDFGVNCGGYTPQYPCHKSGVFDVIGRDPFFINMVTACRRFTVEGTDTSIISFDSLHFDWFSEDDQITVGDEFFTYRWRSATETDLINGSAIYKDFTYQYYPEPGQYSIRNRDRGWVVKLESTAEGECSIGEKLPATMIQSFDWDIWGPCTNWCQGSFLAVGQTTIRDGVQFSESYGYTFAGNHSNDDSVSNLESKWVTDAWGVKTTTNYSTDHLYLSDTTSFYCNTLIGYTVTRKGDTILDQETTEFYGNTSTSGFAGQPSRHTLYVYDNGSLTDTRVTEFRYWKEEGRGNLTHVVDAEGDSTAYHYAENLPMPLGPGLKAPPDSNGSGEATMFNPVGYYEVAPDGSETPFVNMFENNQLTWYRSEQFGSEEYETVEFSVHDSVSDSAVVIPPIQGATTLVMIDVSQNVDYTLTVDAGAGSQSYTRITKNSDVVALVEGGGTDSSRFWAEVGDEIVIEAFQAAGDPAGVYKGQIWYKQVAIDSAMGIARPDSLSAYEERDFYGNILRAVGPNRYLSRAYYDNMFRVEKVCLPYNIGSTSQPIVVEDVIFVSPDLSAEAYAILHHCSTDTVSVYYPSQDPPFPPALPPDDDPHYVYLQFNTLDLSEVQSVDSAFLDFYCFRESSPTRIRAGRYTSGLVHCSQSAPDSIPTPGLLDLEVGAHTLNVGSTVDGWHSGTYSKAIGLIPVFGDAGLISTDHPDSGMWPRLRIYVHRWKQQDTLWTMRFSYDDSLTDGDGIERTIETTVDSTAGPLTGRLWWDEFGRNSTNVSLGAGDDSTFTQTAYDFYDRISAETDQLGFATQFEYDDLSRLKGTTFPGPFNSKTEAEYFGTSATDPELRLDTLFSFPNTGLFGVRYVNENGDSVKEYSDVRDKLRLRQRFNGNDTLSTYFDYDDLGNPTLQISPEGPAVDYHFNSVGELIWESRPNQHSSAATHHYLYDRKGNRTHHKTPQMDADEYFTDEFWLFTEYDALDRPVRLGFINEGSGDSTFFQRMIYDQYGGSRSRGRLALSYSTDHAYHYGESYRYDPRGRVIHKKVSFRAALDSTLDDSAFVVMEQQEGSDTANLAIRRIAPVSYSLKRQFCPTGDSSFLAVYLRRDGHTEMADKIWRPDGGASDSTTGVIACLPGDTVMIVAFCDIGSYPTRFDGKVHYHAYDIPQYYLVQDEYERSVGYEYNWADKITRIQYPDGSCVTYAYDEYGRLNSVGTENEPDCYAVLTYTDRNEVELMTLGGGLESRAYLYTARGWFDRVEGSRFSEYLDYYYQLESYNGNVVTQTVSVLGTDSSFHYIYDDLDRLTGTQIPYDLDDWQDLETFAYDDNGNRLNYWRDGADSSVYSMYPGTDELAVVNDGSLNTFLYDWNGNLIYDSRKDAKLTWDHLGNLESVRLPVDNAVADDSILFGYNNAGERVYKVFIHNYQDLCDTTGGGEGKSLDGRAIDGTEDGLRSLDIEPPPGPRLCWFRDTVATMYVRGADGKILAEYRRQSGDMGVGSGLRATYIYAGDERIAMRDADGKLYFYLNDHLGSARVVIDSVGTARDKYKYWSFGEGRDIVADLNQDYRYTGKPFDAEGGFDLYYFGARYYDPTLGRFVSVDPFAGKYPDWSPYVYTLDNPMKFVDPDGAVVKPAPGSSEAFRRQTAKARSYLKSRGVATFEDLHNRPEVTYVRETSKHSGYSNPVREAHYHNASEAPGAIEWNPYEGLETSAGGLQSPALGLVHEMGHATYWLDDPTKAKQAEFEKDNTYGTLMERLVIQNFENPAAVLLGEATRQDYQGKWYTTTGPTSTDEFTESMKQQLYQAILKVSF